MADFNPTTVVLPGGEAVQIRRAGAADAADVLAHRRHMAVTSAHNVTDLDEVTDDEASQRAWLEERLPRAWELFLIARRVVAPHELLGSLHCHSYNRRVLAHSWEFGISINEPWRGRGVGGAMIRAMLDWARAHPTAERVSLGVYADNDGAIRLYRRLGFVEEGRRSGFFKRGPGEYVDDIQMALWVKPRST